MYVWIDLLSTKHKNFENKKNKPLALPLRNTPELQEDPSHAFQIKKQASKRGFRFSSANFESITKTR
jgi:hypothetical protein